MRTTGIIFGAGVVGALFVFYRFASFLKTIKIEDVVSAKYTLLEKSLSDKFGQIQTNAEAFAVAARGNRSRTKKPTILATTDSAKYSVNSGSGSVHHRFAYVTLLHGIDESMKYRGYLLNCLIMSKALRSFGSKADFIVLLGFASSKTSVSFVEERVNEVFNRDLQMLKDGGLKLHFLPRLVGDIRDNRRINFAEMALLKIAPWSFTEYDRLQYLDGDVMPTRNLDCYFQLSTNTFNTGSASPLNSGWFLAIPDRKVFLEMRELAIRRLSSPWDEENGWGTKLPKGVYFRGQMRQVERWAFNGASLDQGLCTHYFVLTHGNATLLDVDTATSYGPNFQTKAISLKAALQCCDGRSPMSSFAHFTGNKKPWLQDLANTRDKSLLAWKAHLDALGLEINSSNIQEMKLKPPLGYWAPNK